VGGSLGLAVANEDTLLVSTDPHEFPQVAVVKSAKFSTCSPTTASLRSNPDPFVSRYSPGIPEHRRVKRHDCGGQIRVPAGHSKATLPPML